MKPKAGKKTSGLAARLAVRRGEFVQLRRRVLSHRWAWLVVFVVGCGLLITPARSSRYPVLTAGEVAVTDVVVERDVVLPDPEATEESRRRASLEVLPVYVFDCGLQTGAGGVARDSRQNPGSGGVPRPDGRNRDLGRRGGLAAE